MTAEFQMQGDVLAEVLREAPDVLTLEELADRVLSDPRSLTEGIALARALRKLDNADLAISDGILVRPTCPSLHFKHLISAVAFNVQRSAI